MKAAKILDSKTVMEAAVVDGRVKLDILTQECTFCNEEHRCLQWVPDRMSQVVWVCPECFLKLNKTFGKIGGALIWA